MTRLSVTRVLLIVDASSAMAAVGRAAEVEGFLADLWSAGRNRGGGAEAGDPVDAAEDIARHGFVVQIIGFGDQAEWLVRDATPVEELHWESPRPVPGRALGDALTLAATVFDGPDEQAPLVVVMIVAGPPTDDFAAGLASFDAVAAPRAILRLAVTIDAADRTVAERFAGVSGIVHEAGHAESGLAAALRAITRDIVAFGSKGEAAVDEVSDACCLGEADEYEAFDLACDEMDNSSVYEGHPLESVADEGLALESLAGEGLDASSPPLVASPTPPAPVAPASGTQKLDEVQFTVYRPRTVRPSEWTPLLAFVHLAERRPDAPSSTPDPIELVRQQAQAVLGASAAQFRDTSVDARQGIPMESEITLIPEIPGVTFNPPNRTFRWVKDVHREEFDMRADAALEGTTARGSIHAYLGVILIARIDLAVAVTSAVREGAHVAKDVVHAAPYRRIFASYSRRDAEVVRQFEQFIETTGDRFLQDVRQLRAGEDWDDGLLRLIDKADVFQLFWSSQSMRSPHVRREWEYALGLGRKNFIRPTFWEDPFPESPDDALPPDALRRLHFHRLSARVAEDASADTNDHSLEVSGGAVSRMDFVPNDGRSAGTGGTRLAVEDFDPYALGGDADTGGESNPDLLSSGGSDTPAAAPARRPPRSSPLQSAPVIACVVCIVVTAVLLGGLVLWQSL